MHDSSSSVVTTIESKVNDRNHDNRETRLLSRRLFVQADGRMTIACARLLSGGRPSRGFRRRCRDFETMRTIRERAAARFKRANQIGGRCRGGRDGRRDGRRAGERLDGRRARKSGALTSLDMMRVVVVARRHCCMSNW